MEEEKIDAVAHTREELAAAIRSVPHGEKHVILLLRPSGGRMLFRFDYRAEWIEKHKPPFGCKIDLRPVKAYDYRLIDERLATLARRVLKTPKEAFL